LSSNAGHRRTGVDVYEERRSFRDRDEAGRLLAERLTGFRGADVVVLAVPRGGVPVACRVAEHLGAALDVVVTRKIPIPGNPEAGYGAVTEDGAIVLNEPLVERLALTEAQIQRQAEQVRAEIIRRAAIFRGELPTTSVDGRTAIIVDDGLASGFTMLAAIRSAQQRGAITTVVAVPVASGSAYDLVKPVVDELVALVVARTDWFAVAGYYLHWHDLTDAEVLEYLESWAKRHDSGH